MLRLDGADAWSIGRWGRVVGDEAAVLEEVIRRIQVLASQTTFTEVVPFSEVIRPALFESPDIFLRAYERARKVYEVVQEEGNEVVYEVVYADSLRNGRLDGLLVMFLSHQCDQGTQISGVKA